MLESRTENLEAPLRRVESSNEPGRSRSREVHFRSAVPSDGREIAALVGRCPGLDANSAYAYVLLCDEFRETCVVARGADDALVGFVTGFVSPNDASRLFLWQIGVDPDYRGRGLAHALLRSFVDRSRSDTLEFLEMTVAPDNQASLALFASYARGIGSRLDRRGRYLGDWLGDGHPDEDRYRIHLGRFRG